MCEGTPSVAALGVRRIDDETYRRLRVRAAERGVSMEEEVRRILKSAVAAPESLGDLATEYFGPEHGFEMGGCGPVSRLGYPVAR